MRTLATAVQQALQSSRGQPLYNNQSAFDPAAFMDMTFNDANSTVRVPVPSGEHVAVITAVATSKWTKKDDPTKTGMRLDVKYSIDDPNVKALLGRDKVELSQGIMLDITEAGSLDFSKGRNVTLGRLRDAVGLNDSSKPFGFRMLEGKVLKIVVGHKPSEAPGAQPGDVFENVNAFVKA